MSEPTQSQAIGSSQSELEELSVPLDERDSFEPLRVGDSLESPDGLLVVDAFVEQKGKVNFYEATFRQDRKVWLRETQAVDVAVCLRREFELLAGLKCSMFPQVYSCFERDGRTYLIAEPIIGPTMADALAAKEMGPVQLLSVLAQLAFAVSQLHAQGWAHLALRPASIVLGKPIRITDFRYAVRLGQKPSGYFYFSGYSAPELLSGEPIDARADVYAIGALLYHGVSGCPIPESGPALAGWQSETCLPGVPQILHKCLGPIDTRYATATDLHRDLLRLLSRYAPRVRYTTASASTIGLEPTRSANQDAWGYCCQQVEAEEGFRSWAIAAVADGMGGMAAGELASTIAVNTVLCEATVALMAKPEISPEEQAKLAAELVRKANRKVCDGMEAQQARGGCTIVCALLLERRLAIAHVGDCRAYLVRNGEMKILTRDHSLAMSLVMQGMLDISQLRGCPERSNVTRSLGERRNIPDYYVDTLVQTVGTSILELQRGDTLVLCSDGLWEPVSEEQVVQVLEELKADLNAAARRLIDLALKNGAPDNATVSLVRIDEFQPLEREV